MHRGRKHWGGRGSCRRYHHGDLRKALIEAGMAILDREDVSRLSLRHLAREAGVTPPAAYRHFRSKEDLLAAIAEEGFADLTTRFADARQETADTDNHLQEIGVAYVRFAAERPGLFRLMFGLDGGISHDTESADSAFGALRDIVAMKMDLPADDPAVRVETIRKWSLVHGFAMLLIDGRLDEATAYEPLLRKILGPDC